MLGHAQLKGLCLSHNRKLADTVLKSQRERIKLLLLRAVELAEATAGQLADAALARMQAELDAEGQRLTALASVNPNVRVAEIDELAERQRLLGDHLRDARVRLDAVRVVVMR